MLHTVTLAIEADTAVSDGKQQQLKGTDSPRNKNKKIHTMGVCKGLLLSAITGEKGVTCSSCAGTHSHAVWFGWIYLAGQPLNGQTDSRVSNSQIFWVSKYVGTRKKSEQTMKFQVLVVQCGIASSLSGLIAWQQMLGECHSSCKKAESKCSPSTWQSTDISTRLPTVRSLLTSSTSGCSRSDPHYWRWRWWQGLLGEDDSRHCWRQWTHPEHNKTSHGTYIYTTVQVHCSAVVPSGLLIV